MHNHAHGIPAVSVANDLDHCLVCTKAKLHKAAHGPIHLHELLAVFKVFPLILVSWFNDL